MTRPSPNDDLRAGLAARLQAAPNVNHARIVPAQREAEYIIPQSLRDELLAALKENRRG